MKHNSVAPLNAEEVITLRTLYSLFRYTSQITHFSHECFLTPLWRTIKNSGQAGSGREDRLEKIKKKRKRNKNLKLPSFCAVLNCSNRADREKDQSNYRFP